MLILKNALAPMGDLETLPDNASWKHVANEYWCLNLIAHPFVVDTITFVQLTKGPLLLTKHYFRYMQAHKSNAYD